MAKLVDALPSGGSVRKDVQVRILFWAPGLRSFPEAFFIKHSQGCVPICIGILSSKSRFIIETVFLLIIIPMRFLVI